MVVQDQLIEEQFIDKSTDGNLINIAILSNRKLNSKKILTFKILNLKKNINVSQLSGMGITMLKRFDSVNLFFVNFHFYEHKNIVIVIFSLNFVN